MSLFIMLLVCSSSIFDIVMIDNEFMYKFAKRLVLVQKLICKHKGLIPDSNVKACQQI